MRLQRHLARALLGTSAALVALALPLGLLAQATRLLPLLVAASGTSGALGAITVLAAGGTGLLLVTLAPPVAVVAVALTLARWTAEGGLRALASHGAGPAVIRAALRTVALGLGLAVLATGVLAEPPMARAMRTAARDLALDGLVGGLARGTQVEPVPGMVLSAPRGLSGPLRVAFVQARDELPGTVTAEGFTLGPRTASLTVTLRGLHGSLRGDTFSAGTARVTLAAPEAPEDLVAGDLTASLPAGVTSVAPARRHAARALWGALAYAAVLWAAALGLRPGRSTAGGIARSAVLPIAGVVLGARVGAAVAMAMHTPGGIWAGVGAVAVGAIALAELTGPGVAPWRVRVL